MNSLFIVVALLCDAGVPAAPEAAIQSIRNCVQTGSILASQGDCLAVRVYTQSRFTHVGAVVLKDGQPYVYDSMNGTGVRCLPLSQYLAAQCPSNVQVLHPAREFTDSQQTRFEQHLKEQIGRPYSIKHYVTGSRCQGLHCSEYLTDTLIASGHIQAENPTRVSPAELIRCLTENHIYHVGETHVIPAPPSVPVDPPKSWCGQLWQGTKSCSYGCWKQMTRWFCCK